MSTISKDLVLPARVHVCQHPLVHAKLSILRDRSTDSKLFRELVAEVALLLGYEATADLTASERRSVETEFGAFPFVAVDQAIAFVPILRAGLGLVDAMLTLVPTAAVYHMGIFREKVNCACHLTIVIVDPSTGRVLQQAADRLYARLLRHSGSNDCHRRHFHRHRQYSQGMGRQAHQNHCSVCLADRTRSHFGQSSGCRHSRGGGG